MFSGRHYSDLYTIAGTSPSEWLGWSVSGAGDVNANGQSEFIVGALFDDTGATDAGQAVEYTGECGMTVDYGAGCQGTAGHVPVLSLAGRDGPDLDLRLGFSFTDWRGSAAVRRVPRLRQVSATGDRAIAWNRKSARNG